MSGGENDPSQPRTVFDPSQRTGNVIVGTQRVSAPDQPAWTTATYQDPKEADHKRQMEAAEAEYKRKKEDDERERTAKRRNSPRSVGRPSRKASPSLSSSLLPSAASGSS